LKEYKEKPIFMELTLRSVLIICTNLASKVFEVEIFTFVLAFMCSTFASVTRWWQHNIDRDFAAKPFKLAPFVGTLWVGWFAGSLIFVFMVYQKNDILLTLLATMLASYVGSDLLIRIEKGILNRAKREIDRLGGGDDEIKHQ
jgi:amino acid transporter